MPGRRRTRAACCCLIAGLLLPAGAGATPDISPYRQILQARGDAGRGWWLPSTGPWTAHFTAGVSAHIGRDFIDWRNLQWRGQFNLPRGLRANAVIRSNRQLAGIRRFEPLIDEGYLEWRAYHLGTGGHFSANLRLGRMRYLRFPFPDRLAIFDLVPGIQDLAPLRQFRTGLDGALLNVDHQFPGGPGLHGSFHLDAWSAAPGDSPLLQAYLYYRAGRRPGELEIRAGRLRLRQLPDPARPEDSTRQPRASAWGGSLYLGLRWRGFRLGAMLERQRGQDLTAGVLLQFAPGLITNLLGSVQLDYTRQPEAISVQLPLLRGSYGYARPAELPAGATLVGEVVAERRSTFWLNSQARNFSEQAYSVGGQVADRELIVVCDAHPWYLKNESPVGRLRGLDGPEDIRAWDSSSARLGEIAQPVIYRYYRSPAGLRPERRLRIRPGIELRSLGRAFRFKAPD